MEPFWWFRTRSPREKACISGRNMTNALLLEPADRQKWVCRAGATGFPLPKQLPSALQKDTSISWGEAMGLTASANQIRSKKGVIGKRAKWEQRLKLSGNSSLHERVDTTWGFALCAPVTKKAKNPKPVLKQLDSVTVPHLQYNPPGVPWWQRALSCYCKATI